MLCLPAPPTPPSPRSALAAATAALDAATPPTTPLATLHAVGVAAQREGRPIDAAAAYAVAAARAASGGRTVKGGLHATHSNLAACLLAARLPAPALAAADAALASLNASPLNPVAARARALALRGRALADLGDAAAAAAATAAASRIAPHDPRVRAAHAACLKRALDAADGTDAVAVVPTPPPPPRALTRVTRVPPRAALAAALAAPALPDRLLTLTALHHAPHTRDAHAFVEAACDVAAPARAVAGARDAARVASLVAGVRAAVDSVTAAGLAPFDAGAVRVVHARPDDASLTRHELSPANVLLVGGLVDDGLLTGGLLTSLHHALERLTVPGVVVVPAAATLTVALVDTSVPLAASGGIPLTAVARAFVPPAPRGGLPPPAGGWRLLSRAAPAFAFDLSVPPTQAGEAMLDLTAVVDGTVTGVLAWGVLEHGGGESGRYDADPTTAPPAASLRPVFHPFARPITVTTGTIVRVAASHNTVASRFRLTAPLPPVCALPPPAWTPGLPAWHAAALADAARNAAYRRAIEAAVARAQQRAAARAEVDTHAGRVTVLDAGGSAGLFGAIAAAAGADAVVVAEFLPAVADAARDAAAGAGVADRVAVVAAAAASLAAGVDPSIPPHGVDVVVVDAFDAGLLGRGAVDTLARCVARVGALGAETVPAGAALWCVGVSLSVGPPPPAGPFATLAPLDAFWWKDGSPAGMDVASLPIIPMTAPARVWQGSFGPDADGAAPSAAPLRGGGVPVTLDVTAAGEMTAVVTWFELDMGGGHRLTTAPAFIDAAAPPTHWGQGLQVLDRWATFAPGDRARLVAKPSAADGGGGVRFALRASASASTPPPPSRWAPRPPWTEAWGGGDAVENPHVARVRYGDLLLIELAQRAPCGLWPAVEGDVRPLVAHSGALGLDVTAAAGALERAVVREAHARAAAGGGEGVPPVEWLGRAVVRAP